MALLCRTVSKVKVGQKTSVILREFGNVQNDLKANLAAKIPQEREYINLFRKTYGKHKIGDVTIDMIYGGMRGLKGLLCETSVLSPEGGIRFRGYTIPECQKLLPTAPDSTELLPESLFWLLITGDVPTESQVRAVSEEWAERATIPPYVNSFLKSLPKDTHPMTQLAAVITVLSRESRFRKAYADGVPKWDYWKYVYEDSMDLIAKLPIIGAKIYRNSFKGGLEIAPIDNSKDWAYNFVHMLGFNDLEFVDLMRLILSIHCDHEGGNVSAHTVHLVGSTLADPYLALASGINGMAGPLHGLANQEVLQFLQKLHQKLGNNPSENQLKQFIRQTIESGQVIPGYGHAVLRKTDPRYTCQREFALRHLPHEPLVELVSRLFEIVPPILMEKGKVKNPWPNVDAHSGVLLHHYGIRELSYYTVIVAMGRALGVLASLVWDRALGMPIERPKSLSTKDLMKHVSQNKQE